MIDQVIGDGGCDFVTELPLTVVGNMLGVPAADRYLLFEWTNKVADTELAQDDLMQMFGQLNAYVLAPITERRTEPRDHLVSRIIHAELDGEQLRDDEIVAHFAQLMASGNKPPATPSPAAPSP